VIALVSLQAQDQLGYVPEDLRALQEQHLLAVEEERQRQEQDDQFQYRRILEFAGYDAAVRWWNIGRPIE
jgi:hypothetical protein